jgi:hypothetical protein
MKHKLKALLQGGPQPSVNMRGPPLKDGAAEDTRLLLQDAAGGFANHFGGEGHLQAQKKITLEGDLVDRLPFESRGVHATGTRKSSQPSRITSKTQHIPLPKSPVVSNNQSSSSP